MAATDNFGDRWFEGMFLEMESAYGVGDGTRFSEAERERIHARVKEMLLCRLHLAVHGDEPLPEALT